MTRRAAAATVWLLAGAVAGAAVTVAGPQAAAPPPDAEAPGGGMAAPPAAYAPVTPGRELRFPADFGSHPEFRTEWWYVTGWLHTAAGRTLGFQVTFFRTKTQVDERNPSAFAAHQLLIAHCALADPAHGRLWHDQRIRRAGLGLAQAERGDTAVWIGDWSLRRDPGSDGGAYEVILDSDQLALHLRLTPTQPVMRNGAGGFSRKGPGANDASYYYSQPHLEVKGSVRGDSGPQAAVYGDAWLDHEWASEYLGVDAAGWDWVGINLDDGGALMAFRIRHASGAPLWTGGTLRDGRGNTRTLASDEIEFAPLRMWRSARTGTVYPVAWRLRAAGSEFEIEPLMNDQENDTRMTTGTIYWEGAIRVYRSNRLAGHGYLELTGYSERLRLK